MLDEEKEEEEEDGFKGDGVALEEALGDVEACLDKEEAVLLSFLALLLELSVLETLVLVQVLVLSVLVLALSCLFLSDRSVTYNKKQMVNTLYKAHFFTNTYHGLFKALQSSHDFSILRLLGC